MLLFMEAPQKLLKKLISIRKGWGTPGWAGLSVSFAFAYFFFSVVMNIPAVSLMGGGGSPFGLQKNSAKLVLGEEKFDITKNPICAIHPLINELPEQPRGIVNLLDEDVHRGNSGSGVGNWQAAAEDHAARRWIDASIHEDRHD
jgi:hypothetical protein